MKRNSKITITSTIIIVMALISTATANMHNNKKSFVDPCEVTKELPKNASYEDKLKHKKLLTACYKKYFSIDSQLNKIDIPKDCQDPLGRYHPVRYLYYKGESKKDILSVYLAVNEPQGFILEDFNKDGTKDYIFVEKDYNNIIIKLTTCMSDTNPPYWSREQVKEIFESQHGYFGSRTEIKLLIGGELFIKHRNPGINDGSVITEYQYKYIPQKTGFYLSRWKNYSYTLEGSLDSHLEIKDYINRTIYSEIRCRKDGGYFTHPCEEEEKLSKMPNTGDDAYKEVRLEITKPTK